MENKGLFLSAEGETVIRSGKALPVQDDHLRLIHYLLLFLPLLVAIWMLHASFFCATVSLSAAECCDRREEELGQAHSERVC